MFKIPKKLDLDVNALVFAFAIYYPKSCVALGASLLTLSCVCLWDIIQSEELGIGVAILGVLAPMLGYTGAKLASTPFSILRMHNSEDKEEEV